MKWVIVMDQTVLLPLFLVAFAAIITLCFVFVLFRKVSRLQIGDKRVGNSELYSRRRYDLSCP